MNRQASRRRLFRIASISALAVWGCGKSGGPEATNGQPPVAASPTSTAPPASPGDMNVVVQQLIAALNEKVQLIATVQDVASAKAVSNRYPDAERRHRTLNEQYRNSLMSESQRKQIEQESGLRMAELEKQWNEHYVRVVLIPGAWENMNPELAPFADMTAYPEDAAGLEAAVTGLLRKSIEIQRQVKDVESARRLSASYRAASARIGVLLARLGKARGVPGGQEADPPAVRQLRQQFDSEWRRIASLSDAARVLNGESERVVTIVSGQSSAESAPVLTELRSGDLVRVGNTLNQMTGIHPPPAWKSQVLPDLLKLLEFERVRGSAAEVLKKGWFAPDQITLVFDAADALQDRGYKENLYEGISLHPGLETVHIERLATLFPESPSRTVGLLRTVGPAAEPVAQKYADHEKREVRICVCEVLRDIGSSASTDVLQKLAEDSNKSVSSKAKEALREIAKPADQRPHLRKR